MITLEQTESLMASSRPRAPWRRGATIGLLGLAMLLGALLAKPDLLGAAGPASWLAPQILLLMVIVLAIRNTTRQRRLAGLMMEAFEAVQLREWKRAGEVLGQVLRYPLPYPAARAESLLALAAVVEADHSYDVSQRIYESILTDKAADPLQLHTASVALAAAMLRTGQTTDAVDLIDRLARVDLPGPLRAQIELLSLFREVTMGQTHDSIERAGQRRQLFQTHLSTRAGYGYALLAAAFDRAHRPDEARRYWHDATLLVRPRELVERFAEVGPVAEKYAAAEAAL